MRKGGRIPDALVQAIVFGWYDGVTDGVATSKGQRRSYRFQLLSWDAEQEMRVYSLTKLNTGSFKTIANLLASIEPPHWPFWVVHWPEASERTKGLEAKLEPLLKSDSLPEFIIASRDVTRGIEHGRALDSVQAKEEFLTLRHREAPFTEWLRFVEGQ